MAFDKAEYWAQKGQPRPKGRLATILQCRACKSTSGTVKGRFFICNTGSCQRQLAKTLADHIAASRAELTK